MNFGKKIRDNSECCFGHFTGHFTLVTYWIFRDLTPQEVKWHASRNVIFERFMTNFWQICRHFLEIFFERFDRFLTEYLDRFFGQIFWKSFWKIFGKIFWTFFLMKEPFFCNLWDYFVTLIIYKIKPKDIFFTSKARQSKWQNNPRGWGKNTPFFDRLFDRFFWNNFL